MTASIESTSLTRLRRRLRAWHVGTLTLVLAILGGGLFFAIRHQFRTELDTSLQRVAVELERAAGIRLLEAGAKGQVVDALDELRIPGRSLYLFDDNARPIRPVSAEEWIHEAATLAKTRGSIDLSREVAGDRTVRMHAEAFMTPDGTRHIAVAAADELELEEQYSALIATFAAGAMAALVLVTLASGVLVRKSTQPIETNIERMKRFMADAAHELRTPVAILRTRAEVALTRSRDAASYEEALAAIAVESKRMSGLVDDLLTLARADAGERPIEHRPCYLDDIALDACTAAKPLAVSSGVTLEIAQFEEAPTLGDPTSLHQATMILLDNAIKYTPLGGRVRVEVGIADGFALVAVEDTGPGIPAADRERFFGRFVRGGSPSSSGRDIPAGAGLGLAIAQWIAEAHNGRIILDDAPGGGTRAKLKIPSVPATKIRSG